MTDNRSGKAKGQGKGVQTTGGDKGSKKTNDYEISGRDRKGSAQGNEKPERERTTGAGVDMDNETKNHSQVAIAPGTDPDKRPRRTSKGEKGSRKPGTELTKEERTAQQN